MSSRCATPRDKFRQTVTRKNSQKTTKSNQRENSLEQPSIPEGNQTILNKKKQSSNSIPNKSYGQGNIFNKSTKAQQLTRQPKLENINKKIVKNYDIVKLIYGQIQRHKDEKILALVGPFDMVSPWIDCKKIQPRLEKFHNNLRQKNYFQDFLEGKAEFKNHELKDETKGMNYIPNHIFPNRKTIKITSNRLFSHNSSRIQQQKDKKSLTVLLKESQLHKIHEKKKMKIENDEKKKRKYSLQMYEQIAMEKAIEFAKTNESQHIRGKKFNLCSC